MDPELPALRTEPTCDAESLRWIAGDESGSSGEELLRDDVRLFTYATVAIDDPAGAAIMEQLRQTLRIQAPEIKTAEMLDGRRRIDALVDLFGPGGQLDGKFIVDAFDKHYMAVAKVVDLLLETYEHERGRDLYTSGEAREIARRLFDRGPRCMGSDTFSGLIATFVSFARRTERKRPRASIDELYSALDAAFRATQSRHDVDDVLLRLTRTRAVATDLSRMRSAGLRDLLDPLIPAIPNAVRRWSGKHRRLSLLADQQDVLTRQWVADLTTEIRSPSETVRGRVAPVDLVDFEVGDSKLHPSLQLADIAAGAARLSLTLIVAPDALDDTRRFAANQLRPVFEPTMSEYSLVPALM
jgi:hypothetical protein